jgi:hypothetical protein
VGISGFREVLNSFHVFKDAMITEAALKEPVRDVDR